jgi:hypothetical protein
MIFLLALAGMAAKAGISVKTVALASKLMGATSKAVAMTAHNMGHTAGHIFSAAQQGFTPLAKFYSEKGFGLLYSVFHAGAEMAFVMGTADHFRGKH